MNRVTTLLLVLSFPACSATRVAPRGETAMSVVQERDPPPQAAPATTTPRHHGALTLDEARRLAAEQRPELQAAQAALAAAQAREEAAGRFPNPILIARIESAPLDGHTLDDAEIVAGISLPLPLSDRRSAERRLEAAGVERERAQVAAELARVEADVHGAFATALFAEAAAQLRQRFADECSAIATQVERRGAAGDATADEQARARLELARANQALRAAARLRKAALAALAAAIGAPDAEIDGVVGELAPTLALPQLEELAARLADHPALRSAQADVVLARAALELAREQRVPDVDFDLLYHYLGETDTPAFDVGLSLPLRASGVNAAREREARAGIDAAAARAATARAGLQGQLRRAHAQLAAALEALQFLREEVLPHLVELLRIEEARAAAGDATAAALGAARRDRIEGELVALDASREALSAWAELRALTGAGAE